MRKKLAKWIMQFALWSQLRLKAKNFYIYTIDGMWKFNIVRGRSVWDGDEIEYMESDHNNLQKQIEATQKQLGRSGMRRYNEKLAAEKKEN